MTCRHVVSLSLCAVLAAVVAGCAREAKKPGANAAAAGGTGANSADAQLTEQQKEIQQAMAELPAADRKLAEAQSTCPVGDGPLGAMGKPYKISVKGRDVFLCCEGCKPEIEADPDKFLAKLDEKKGK